MIEGNLDTTNLLLAVLAAVSVLQALVFIGAVVLAFRLYRRILQTIRDIEERQIAPLAANVAGLVGQVDGILADVKGVTTRVTQQAERVNTAIHQTMHSVDDSAGRVFDSVESRIVRIVRLVLSVTSAVQGIFRGRRSSGRRTGNADEE